MLVVVAYDLRPGAPGMNAERPLQDASSQIASSHSQESSVGQPVVSHHQRPTLNMKRSNTDQFESSAVDQLLDSMQESLRANKVDQIQSQITVLRQMLSVTNGCKKRIRNQDSQKERKNVGGIQFSSKYLLDSVLLADNLKALNPESHLLLAVVRQFLG